MAAYVQDAIMLLGDSITQRGYEFDGFAARLSLIGGIPAAPRHADVYNRKMDVINRGYSGYNTDWIIPVFEQIFATQHEQQHVPKVRLLVIWFGANDAAVPPKEQHVPLERYKGNLSKLIWMVSSPESPRYSPDTRVVLMTPPPVNTLQWSVRQASKDPPQGLDRDFEFTRTYTEAAKEVAEKEGVAVVDVWTKFWEGAGRVEAELKKYLTDGLHLNGEGYAIVFEELTKTIAARYPEYRHDNLRFVFAPFDQICADLSHYRKVTKKRNAFES